MKRTAVILLWPIFLLQSSCSLWSVKPAKKNNTKPSVTAAVVVPKTSSRFQLRPMKTFTMENGLKVFLLNDDSLPRVSVHMLVRAGLRTEPESLSGLNALVANMLEQGTQSKTINQLADVIGSMGTDLSVSPSLDMTLLSMDALSKDQNKLIEVFSDVVTAPAFKETEIVKMKSLFTAQIQKKQDRPSEFAEEKFSQFLFGNHVYAKSVYGNEESIAKITKSDVIKHYLSWYRPNNSLLVVTGKWNPDVETKLTESFKKWTVRETPSLTLNDPDGEGKGQVRIINKPGMTQAQLRLGHLGTERRNDDYLALRVANEILGGGMSSRFMQKIREEQGLTYSISSRFDFLQTKGAFVVSTFTKNESVGKVVDETLKVFNEYVAQGVNEKELNAAKNQLLSSFSRAIETVDSYAMNIMFLDFYGVDTSYLVNFTKNIDKLKVADINAVIGKYMQPANLKVLVYGDAKSFKKQLEAYKPEVL